jgi:hypothetical protein
MYMYIMLFSYVQFHLHIYHEQQGLAVTEGTEGNDLNDFSKSRRRHRRRRPTQSCRCRRR